jgi:hypothetical protein
MRFTTIVRGCALALLATVSISTIASAQKPKPGDARAGVMTKATFTANAKPAAVNKAYPKDGQDHPGRTDRAAKIASGHRTDTETTAIIAKHVTMYAINRYGIKDIVTEPDIERARKEVYDFVSWKYGNPTLVQAQWLTAGYQHFDPFVREAGAALMGTELAGPGDVIRLPKDVTTWLKARADSIKKDPNYNPCLGLEQSTTEEAQQDWGVMLVQAGCNYLIQLAAEAADKAIERIGISAQALSGRKVNRFSDSDVEFMILLKRNPTLALQPGQQPRKYVDTNAGN